MLSRFERFPHDKSDEPSRVSGIVLAAIRFGDLVLRNAPLGDIEAAATRFQEDVDRIARIDMMLEGIENVLDERA